MLVSILVSFIFCIFTLFLAIGYANWRVGILKEAVAQAFDNLKEGMLKIINGEGVFEEDFKDALASAIHDTLKEVFEEPFEEINRIEKVPLMITIHTEQNNEMTAFDFSRWDNEKHSGIVGVSIYTKQKFPEKVATIIGESPFFYPDALLRYVREKDKGEDAAEWWIWDEESFFLFTIFEDGELFNDIE